MRYRIEFEGYNDGHPYESAQYDRRDVAERNLKEFRRVNEKVRYRLIEILEDWS